MSRRGELSLGERLAGALPQDVALTFYHISTPPTSCPAIFAAPPGSKPDRTYCESHFLTVSIEKSTDDFSQEILVFAIEVLVYTTKHLTTLFVSKADSTGYISFLALPKTQASPLKSISTTFISYLVHERQRPGIRLVVSLFARAQDQYLFPGSVENPSKHVLDDRGLVKWWCRTLDPVLREYPPRQAGLGGGCEEHDEVTMRSKGYLIVPGFDKYESKAFFPKADNQEGERWGAGHPLRQISTTPSAPPRCLIPHFPDDPKARFLDELDEELPDASSSQIDISPTKRSAGQWKSVKTLEQFWEMMAYRQECSSGRLVGFIWVIFTPSDVRSTSDTETTSSQMPALSEADENYVCPLNSIRAERHISAPRIRRKPGLSGPIVTRQPRTKTASSDLSTSSQPDRSQHYTWPTDSRGQIVLEEKEYTRARDVLLRLDFATSEVATTGTKRWTYEVAVMAGTPGQWGQRVVGEKVTPKQPGEPGHTSTQRYRSEDIG
ncbi:hypothetical protein LTR04_005042 [Oleoguttula sp. CCFEE 6159]|nr:hypothetical protein LTR04_005042 [Oleoguttula sp. CCFEE 6159]